MHKPLSDKGMEILDGVLKTLNEYAEETTELDVLLMVAQSIKDREVPGHG